MLCIYSYEPFVIVYVCLLLIYVFVLFFKKKIPDLIFILIKQDNNACFNNYIHSFNFYFFKKICDYIQKYQK